MATLPYVTVDAFTDVKFRGNPAAVVIFPKENTVDALRLRASQKSREQVVWSKGLMPARTALAGKDGFPPDSFLADVAREMQLSETAFVKCRPPPRGRSQPYAEGEAGGVGLSKKTTRVSFGGVMNGDVGGSDDDGAGEDDGVAASPALSFVSSTSSSKPKIDRDAPVYVEYDLRWFTKTGQEVDLCGHASLAAAHALYELGPGLVPDGAVVRFHTKGGLLPVSRVKDKQKDDDPVDENEKKKKKTRGPLLELALPCSAPRLGALGGADEAGFASDDSDEEFFETKKAAAAAAAAAAAERAKESKESNHDDAKDSTINDPPPNEAGCFFTRDDLALALGVKARHVESIIGRNSIGDVFVSLTSVASLTLATPNSGLIRFITKGGRGLVVTAKGGSVLGDDSLPVDFSLRFFAPNLGIDEDHVTGSAFVGLGPYWQTRLKKKNGEEMVAHQCGKRGGVVRVAVVKKKGIRGALDETKVMTRGFAVSVLKGEILCDGFDAEE